MYAPRGLCETLVPQRVASQLRAAALRLKNLQVGYTVLQSLISGLGAERLEVYVSGENLWETTDLRVPVDPELLQRV